MSEGFFDRNLKRLLRLERRDPAVSESFRSSLRQRILNEAARLRGEVGAAAGTRERSPFRWSVAAAAAILVVVAGLAWRLNRGAPLDPDRVDRIVCHAAPRPLVVEADRRVVLSVDRGATGAADVVRGGHAIASLTLQDGAEVVVEPDASPWLAVHRGVVVVEAARDIHIEAGGVSIDAKAFAVVAVEHMRQGAEPMKSWLIPGGVGAAVGAAVVAIVLHRGDAEIMKPASRPAPIEVAKPLVVEVPASRPVQDDERAGKMLAAERKIAELEKKLAASKKEADKLAAELVQKKGVTIENVTARLAELRKGGFMGAMLPGRTSDLIADLKGLGPAGTQALVDLLKSEKAEDRALAAKLLEDLKDPAAIPSLLEVALHDSDKLAANMAGHAIALMEDPRAINALKDIYAKDGSWESRVNSLWGLVNLGDAYGLEQAIAYMGDSNVSKQARAALGANVAVFMHRPEVMPIVDRTVQDFYQSDQVMEIAVGYYAALNSSIGRDRLHAIANDTRVSQAIRTAAQQALAQ